MQRLIKQLYHIDESSMLLLDVDSSFSIAGKEAKKLVQKKLANPSVNGSEVYFLMSNSFWTGLPPRP